VLEVFDPENPGILSTGDYLNPSTLEVREGAPSYGMPRGDTLCEEMGAGKTAICIALIILTRHQLAVPDHPHRNVAPLLSLRSRGGSQECTGYTPPAGHAIARTNSPQTSRRHTKSLLARKEEFDDNWSFGGLIDHLNPFYLHSNDSDTRMSARGVTKHTCDLPRKVYLSCATLVVCPLSLYEQWKSELYKFCKEGVLRTLFLADKGQRTVPPPQELLKYDVSAENIARHIKILRVTLKYLT